MEHVCSHLRAYAQGSVDFQNSIGSAQIGKVNNNEFLPINAHVYVCICIF